MVTPGTLKRQNPSQYSSVGSGEGQGGYCMDIEKRTEAEIEILFISGPPDFWTFRHLYSRLVEEGAANDALLIMMSKLLPAGTRQSVIGYTIWLNP
jgi:hypothetical protein